MKQRRYGHARRYREITDILARHGLGFFSVALGVGRFVPMHRGWLGHTRRAEPYTQPEHLRLALEELGATFVKLGQILSTRPDLVPPDYLAELTKLQDAAPSVPWDAIEASLVEELGRPIAEIFAGFERTPLASASIGQAHAATLKDGTEVVVKVRRPGVAEQVNEDLEVLSDLALTASRYWELAGEYDLVSLAQEFAETLRAELDYVREGRNAERIAANLAGDPGTHVPRVYWNTSTTRVLTLERIHGIKINDLAALDAAGIDRKELAQHAARVVLQMVFEDGFFHADPHPGNFFIQPGGHIALIDFGMVGTIDETIRERLVDVVLAVVSKDPDRLVDAFLALGVARQRVDRGALRDDLQQLVARYFDRTLAELEIGPLLSDVLAVVRRHHLHMPANLALILKLAVMVEGLGAQLDPEFNLMTALEPFGQQLLVERLSPRAWARRVGQASLDAAQLGVELPAQVRRLLAELERGTLEIGIRPREVEPVLQRIESITNRLILGMLTSAFIVGLAMLMSVYHPPGWDRLAGIVFTIGLLFASTFGAYLIWSVLRSWRR